MARRFCVALLILLVSCSMSKVTFTGTYMMDNGTMILEQAGDKVTGTYTGKYSGTIEGTVKDGRLLYEWKQAPGERGRGVYILSADGKSISGTWGFGDSEVGGGELKGKKIK